MSFVDHKNNAVTHDTLFDGKLVCLQHRKGYRFSIDSIILAHFIRPDKGDTILDLGTGGGILSLIMAYRWENIVGSITGVEKQNSLFHLAKRNIAINGLEGICHIISADVKSLFNSVARESFSRVVCNPPFYKTNTGRTNENREALEARHQISASLDDFISAASAAVKNRGATYFIYPAGGLSEMILASKRNQLEPKKIRFVYSYPRPEKNSGLVLIKCLKNGGSGVDVLPPFYVYKEKNGAYSPEMAGYYAR
ncbi:MAG: methyltransferase [Deltaproteobacteria bacterium]|nr:methyltransferase [Deltaproteobacteria bacterium]